MPTTEYRVFAADRDTGEAVTLNIAADSPEAAERFQSAPLCRGDAVQRGHLLLRRSFNPRPCVGATRLTSSPPATRPGFNPRPCVGATFVTGRGFSGTAFQSAPLCRGDHPSRRTHRRGLVSIRAPV